MLLSNKDFENLLAYQYSREEQELYPLLDEYFKNKYGVHVFKYRYWPPIKIGGVISICLATNADRHHLSKITTSEDWRHHFPTDAKKVSEIIKERGLQDYFYTDSLMLSFENFESAALVYCYGSAFDDFKQFRMKYFNPDTMERIGIGGMIVVYKTKELMEQAADNGEQDRISEDYYQFIKKYDTFNFITRGKHLLLRFDYAERARAYDYHDFDDWRASVLEAD